MKTDDLITALVADHATRPIKLSRTFFAALAGGTVVAAILFVSLIGVRPDIGAAAATLRFPFKFAVTISLAIPAIFWAIRLSRPEAAVSRTGWLVLLIPAFLLLLGVGFELSVVPSSAWLTGLLGVNALACLAGISLLSIGPLTCLLFALRQGAPARPRLAGALAGLASAAIGASLYVVHCPDDSPLFVATWYSVATGVIVVAGSLLGSRILRW